MQEQTLTVKPTVINLLDCLTQKVDNDARIDEKKAGVCKSCILSMQYILQPIPHRKLNQDFQPDTTYCDYLRHLSKSVRGNKFITEANYQNLVLLTQTLQTELWGLQ